MTKVQGGDKFAKVMGKFGQSIAKASHVEIGFLPDKTYPNGTLVAMVAAIQEFGAPARNIPPRPFFRQMVKNKKKLWPDKIAAALKATSMDADKTLAFMGMEIKEELQNEIVAFSGAPLSAKTIAAKGSDKQLIDTKVMFNSIDFVVKKGAFP